MSQPNTIEKFIGMLDAFQQQHPWLAFPYGIIKKYGDDQGGYQAALIAYYGFVSLFPLLIVAMSVIQLIAQNNLQLRQFFLTNVTSYFPVIGGSLTQSINTPSRSGAALVIGLLITLYGTRGLASVIQQAQDHIWAVPRNKRAGFPKSLFKGFGIMLLCGIGFLLAASLTGYAVGTHHMLALRIALGTIGFIVLFAVFWGLLTFGSSESKHPHTYAPGALFAAIGLVILQAIGGYLVGHQLRSQTGLSAQFAIVLALLFWLYLQAQVLVYAIELNTVRKYKLWPRAIDSKTPLPADEAAYTLYRLRETF